MRKTFLFSFLAVTFLLTAQVYATDQATVTATVTLQNVSLTVDDGTINYGTLALNSSTGTVALSETQTITNAGNVNVDVLIKGQNSANWNLAGASGSNEYVHRFCNATASSCATAPTNYSALTTNNQNFSLALTPAGTVNLDLYLTTPSVSTHFIQQNVDVTLVAVAS